MKSSNTFFSSHVRIALHGFFLTDDSHTKVLIPSRDVAQPGSALRSGRRSRRFKSGHPDHFIKSECRLRNILLFFFLRLYIRCNKEEDPKQNKGICSYEIVFMLQQNIAVRKEYLINYTKK